LGLDGFPVQIQNKNLFLDLHFTAPASYASGFGVGLGNWIFRRFSRFSSGLYCPESRWQNATFSYNKADQFRSKFLTSFIDWNAISGDG
jgi:hypothetical protein